MQQKYASANKSIDAKRVWASAGITRTRHQSYVEGAEFFDNRYFEISNNEAAAKLALYR